MATGGGGQNLSDEFFDVNCTICKRKNRSNQAEKYCIECKKYLCNDCVEIHIEHNEEHKLVDAHGGEVNLLTEKCQKHNDKLIELFCVGHDEVVCSFCALQEHRTCDELKCITDNIDDLNKDHKMHGLPEQLKATIHNVDRVITALEGLSKCEHKLLGEIEEHTKRLLAKIDILRRNAKQEVSTKLGHTAADATEKRNICIAAKTNILKCMDDMSSAGNRESHLFILKKKGQSMVRNLESLCNQSEIMMKRFNVVFKQDLRIEGSLNEFSSLVSMKVVIDTSVEGDKQIDSIIGYRMGCCLIPDGTVMLADAYNKRLKHMDPTDCTIKDHCDLERYPYGITNIGLHEIAVGTDGYDLQVVSLGNKMTCSSRIRMYHNATKIVQSNGELFTIDYRRVYVYDLTGKLLREIYKNKSGKDLFSQYTNDICLNQTENRVYVADWKYGLICTDRAGQEVFRLSCGELGLDVVQGVCAGQRGNLLVCGNESNNVVKITDTGRVIGEILSKDDGIEKPNCLCYDADKRRLYVGSGTTAKLLMYQRI